MGGRCRTASTQVPPSASAKKEKKEPLWVPKYSESSSKAEPRGAPPPSPPGQAVGHGLPRPTRVPRRVDPDPPVRAVVKLGALLRYDEGRVRVIRIEHQCKAEPARQPVPVEPLPGAAVVVGPIDTDDVGDVVLEVELRRVDADRGQPLVGVLGGPGAYVGQRAQPVDAGVGPEVDEDDPAPQSLGRQRVRVQPAGRPRARFLEAARRTSPVHTWA